MSSDTFTVRIERVDGDTAEVSCLTSTAGGLDDLCATRSFALHLLHDAASRKEDVRDELQAALHATGARATRLRTLWPQLKKLGRAPILKAIRELTFDEEWYRDNLDRFVRSVDLVTRHNHVGEEELAARLAVIDDELDPVEQMWEHGHWYTLRVTVTDPKWLAHLVPGIEYGTTASDWWGEDPRSPELPPDPPRPTGIVPKRRTRKASAQKASARPRVLLGTIADLGEAIPARGRTQFAACPVFLECVAAAERNRLFDRIAEPESKGVGPVMNALGRFVDRNSELIQAAIGATEDLNCGFHTGATLEEARKSFLADGYEVLELSRLCL